MKTEHMWWQNGVIYQIYPRSFQDGNGDGIGDLPGIIARLDYLQWLGVDAIWISPIFPSPMADFGYDVADYTNVDPLFGTLDDFDHLLAEAHARSLRILLDLVPNHSSDEHAWFVQSRADRTNPYRDWYIWRDPAPDGGPPNNWRSNFGGPAWSFDATTGQYYLHLFDPKQPDLNWRNPAVRTAMHDAMRFWFRRGVDGFRIDVIWMLIKHPELLDNPPNPNWQPGEPDQWQFERVYDQNQPEIHAVIRELRAVSDEFSERLLIGEIYMGIEELVAYYGAQLDEVHLPFNFNLIMLKNWNAAAVRDLVTRYEAALPAGAWPNWVVGNHDQSRVATRLGPAMSRLTHMLLLTLRGTPTLYNGDELAMQDVPVPLERIVDPQGRRAPALNRDPVRSPMLWEAAPGAGFTTSEPWLPLAADYATRNVAMQQTDPHSMLALVRQLLELRRAAPALQIGHYHALETQAAETMAYLRSYGPERLLVVLNFGDTPVTLDLSTLATQAPVAACTHMDRHGLVDLAALHLRACEGVVLVLGE